MGCAGECEGCGQPGYWQIHITVAEPMEGAFAKQHFAPPAKLITIGNIDAKDERNVALEYIYTISANWPLRDAQNVLRYMRGELHGKTLREKIEVSPPGYPVPFPYPWLYRELHVTMPYCLPAWHAAQRAKLPVSVNLGEPVATRPLIATVRQYMNSPTDWQVLKKEALDQLPFVEQREEYTVFDTDPFYDRKWLLQE